MLELIINSGSFGVTVAPSHFGSNYLANREVRHNQGIEGDNVFGHAADIVGTNAFRYPGGAITEMFMDLSDPRHFTAGPDELINVTDRFTHRGEDALTPVGQFLDFVSSREGTATIVLPTITYFEDLSSGDEARIAAVEAEIKEFVINSLSASGGHTISAFEIGNEYPGWNNGNFSLIPGGSWDYAMLARNISVWVKEAIQSVSKGKDIDIVVQSSFFAQGPNGNNQLIEAFFDQDLQRIYKHVESVEDAVGAITATSIHSYPYTPWDYDAYKGTGSILDDLELISDWRRAFEEYGVEAGVQPKEIDAYVTEWNTRSAAIKNGTISGVQEATAMLFQFDTLLRAGVKDMHVWPVLENNNSDLVNGTNVEDLSLDFNGLIFSRLSRNLLGLDVLNIDQHHDVVGDANSDLLTFAYGSDHGFIFYVASISDQEIRYDLDIGALSDLTQNYGTLSGGLITSISGDPSDEMAQARFLPLSASVLEGHSNRDGIVTVDLQPWELMEFHFEAHPLAQDAADDTTDVGYLIVGSDLANSHIGSEGDDTIRGEGGADTISGGDGDDLISAGSGHDTIFGGMGHDKVFGDNGQDLVYLGDGDDHFIDNEQGGKYGRDTIFGGEGNDTIESSGGANELHGEIGDDLIDIRGGADLATGGPGDDTFTIVGESYYSNLYVAFNASSSFQAGTNNFISLEGKLKTQAVVDGGNGFDTIRLSDGDDALFLHDSFSEFGPSIILTEDSLGKPSVQRLSNIEEILGLKGDDIIDLTSPDYSLSGTKIMIDGGPGSDVIWGSDADETIIGGEGSDIIFGGSGSDVIFGGYGADTFEFTKTSENTTLMDFNPGEGDLIIFYSTHDARFNPDSVTSTPDGFQVTYFDESGECELNISLADDRASQDSSFETAWDSIWFFL